MINITYNQLCNIFENFISSNVKNINVASYNTLPENMKKNAKIESKILDKNSFRQAAGYSYGYGACGNAEGYACPHWYAKTTTFVTTTITVTNGITKPTDNLLTLFADFKSALLTKINVENSVIKITNINNAYYIIYNMLKFLENNLCIYVNNSVKYIIYQKNQSSTEPDIITDKNFEIIETIDISDLAVYLLSSHIKKLKIKSCTYTQKFGIAGKACDNKCSCVSG